MKQISMWRLGTIVAVALFSLILVFPSARYLLALSGDTPKDKLEELRESAIPLGLDLRGGADVVLMIDESKSIESAVRSMVSRLQNQFRSDKINATARGTDSIDTLEIALTDPADARRVRSILGNEGALTEVPTEEALVASAADGADPIRIQVAADSLADRVQGDIKAVEKILRDRLDRLGMTQPSISVQGRNRIRIQLPGEGDPTSLIDNLKRMAVMEFRLTHPGYRGPGAPSNPIESLLDENRELRIDAIPPLGYEVVDFKFGNKNRETGEIEYTEGKMLVQEAEKTLFTGENLRSAGVLQDPSDIANPMKVSLLLDREGAKIFADITKESVDNQKKGGEYYNMAVLLDGIVWSAPRLGVVITGGSAVIEGGFKFEEAQDLAYVLKGGSLPAPIKVESKRAVGATLGNEAIFAGVKALVVGGTLVAIFMILYYGMSGVISVVALVLNVLIVLAILAMANATLTLSGIGGILLTIGMAVDANVLIYERIREEFDGGRPLRQAISVGFDRAFRVILDSNLTTLMTAMVLLQFSTGAVFGFALTMTFGLLANLFTGLTVTYTLCVLWFNWRDKLSLGPLRPFKNSKYDFIKMRLLTWTMSGVLLAGALGLVLFQGGLKFGVDFAGGLVADIRFEDTTSEGVLHAMIQEVGLEGERVQKVSGLNDYVIKVKMVIPDPRDPNAPGALEATEALLHAALAATFDEGSYEIIDLSSFGPETGQEFRSMAISVVLLASIAILFYLWLRFELVFGVAAVIALVHDLVFVLLFSSLWGVDITLDVVAALLVLLGYSVNDTIVIFDRIRENARRGIGDGFKETCNISMNQSLSRTLITSGTALLAIMAMLLIGGEGLKPFAKVLLIGSIVGTYSSSFIAAPLVYAWNERRRSGGSGSQGDVVETLKAKDKPQGPEPAKAPDRESRRPGAAGVAGVPRRRGV